MPTALRKKQQAFKAFKAAVIPPPSPVSEADFKVTKKFVEAVQEGFTEYRNRDSREKILGGLELLAIGNAHKNAHYRSRRDTHHGSHMHSFAAVAKSMGFQEVARYPFKSKPSYAKRPQAGHTYVYARPDGLVLTWDTYRHSVNGAKLTFQWQSTTASRSFPDHGSGGLRDISPRQRVFVGDMDVREGLREKVTSLTEAGKLKAVWAACNDFAVQHCYTGERDYSLQKQRVPAADKDFSLLGRLVDEVQAARTESMPRWVKQMTGAVPYRR